MMDRGSSHGLFFEPGRARKFPPVLEEVQEYISSKYSALLVDSRKNNVKDQIKFHIQKYLTDNRIMVEDMEEDELIDKLYEEMAEFSFLTKYITGTGIEEIDINSWKDIEVYYSGGKKE